MSVTRRKSNDAHRKFEPLTASSPTDKYHRVRIICSEKDCEESLIFSRRGPINPHQAAQWFRDKGWEVGGDKRGDLCPKHGKRHKEEDMKSPDLVTAAVIPEHAGEPHDDQFKPGASHKVMVNLPVDRGFSPKPSLSQPLKPMPQLVTTKPLPSIPMPLRSSPVVAVSLPPATTVDYSIPSRTDKRLIHLKLEEVYGDEDTGYKDGWTDQRVAVDLQFPIEWIAAVREDAYGPEQGQGMAKLEADMQRKLDALTLNMVHIEETINRNVELCKEMVERMKEYKKEKEEIAEMMKEYYRRKS